MVIFEQAAATDQHNQILCWQEVFCNPQYCGSQPVKQSEPSSVLIVTLTDPEDAFLNSALSIWAFDPISTTYWNFYVKFWRFFWFRSSVPSFFVWEKLRQSGWRVDKSVLSALPRVLLGSHTRVGWGRQHLQAPGSFEHCPALNIAQHLNIAQNRIMKHEDIYVNMLSWFTLLTWFTHCWHCLHCAVAEIAIKCGLTRLRGWLGLWGWQGWWDWWDWCGWNGTMHERTILFYDSHKELKNIANNGLWEPYAVE